MADGVKIKDVNNILSNISDTAKIPVSSGTETEPLVVTAGGLKGYINTGMQAEIDDLSTIRSGAALGATAVQIESDPTVPNWAKEAQKPSYSYSEITGKPTLSTVATSGSYNDLTNKPTIPAAQIQSDWEQSDNTKKDYIKNKPSIPAAQIQSDWSQSTNTALDYIKNKPKNVSAFNNDAGYTTNTGTITSVKMNGSTVASSGEADLGTVITSHQDISGKADKVTTATNGNFAALDSNGNLTDSGHKHSDYLTSAREVPSGGNLGQILKRVTGDDYAYAWSNETTTYPSAYCTTAGGTATKVANCSLWTNTPNTYLHILMGGANTYQGELKLKVNALPSAGATIYINGTVSSSTNYTLPAGSYIIFYDGTNYYFRTDGKIPTATSVLAAVSDLPTVMGASGTNHASGLVPDPGSTQGTTKFLREDGSWQVPPSGGGGEVNTIESISVNTVAQTPDANKNVDITVPDVSGKEDSSNKVTSLSSSSTDTQYPSAKATYTYINTALGDIETLLSNI